MKITKTKEDLVAINELSDLQIEELALVASHSVPVNPGAVITFVKAQPAEEEAEISKEDVQTFKKFLKSIFSKSSPKEVEVENPELTAALAKQAELQKAIEENAAEIEKAKAAKKPAASADNYDPDNDGDNDNNDAQDTDEDDGKGKGKKMKSIDADVLVTLATSITSLQEQIVEMNKSFLEVVKGNAGAATAKEAAGHVANATAEANSLVAAAKETVVTPTTEVTSEETTEVAKAENALIQSIEAALARNLEPVTAKLNSLTTQVTDLSSQVENTAVVAKAATDKVAELETTVNGVGDEFSGRILKAIEDAEVETLRLARVNDIPNTITNTPVAKANTVPTHQDLAGHTMKQAVIKLMGTQLPVSQ